MSRVVHLTSVHPAFDIRIFHRQGRALRAVGYDMVVVAPHHQSTVVDGVRIEAVPPPASRLARLTRTVWQVYREARRLDADLYHFHDPELIPVGLRLQASGKPVVYDMHEDAPRAMLGKHYLPGWTRGALGHGLEVVERLACGRFSALIAATPAIAERYAGIARRTVVVQNFPDPAEFSCGEMMPWTHRPNGLAYVGAVAENRGAIEMLRALDLVTESLHARLLLAGEFSPSGLLERSRREPGWRRTEYRGSLDRPGVAALLGEARIGLVLLAPEPRYQRAYPIKMFEYMAAGLPVIASDFPLWRSIVQGAGCGLLVDPQNPMAIRDAIERLLRNPQEAERMGARGREAVRQKYNWPVEEQKLLNLYQELLGARL
jgi:glycosyltransferase involved in cell wall biosynthesis